MNLADELEALLATDVSFEQFEAECGEALQEAELDRATRGRICGYVVTCAIMRRRPVSEVVRLFGELRAVGFPDASSELLHAGAFARYCLVEGDPAAGANELGLALARARQELGAEWVRAYEPLFDEVVGGQRPR